MRKAVLAESMKKVFIFLLPAILTIVIVLSIISVARAAETGSVPAKPAGEETVSEAVVASPARESGREAAKEAEPVKEEEVQKETAPAATATPEEKK